MSQVPDEHNYIQDQKRKKHVYTDRNAKSSQQKCEETKCNQCILYAKTITSKFTILSSSAKCNANVHRTQLSSTDNNEVYIH